MTQPHKILIVEDEVMIAMCLEMELQNAGYKECLRVVKGECYFKRLPD